MKTLLIPFGYLGYPQTELIKKIEASKTYLNQIGIDFVSTKNVITLEDCEQASTIAKTNEFDYCIVLIASWIEAPNVMNIISAAGLQNTPILLWSHDNVFCEEKNEYISFGSIAVAAVLREAFEEFGLKFKFVVGNDDDTALTKEILDFDRAAKAVKKLAETRIGMLGYASMGMYTGLGDHMKVKKIFGAEVVQLDQYTLINKAKAQVAEKIQQERVKFITEWDFAEGVSNEAIDKTVAMYLAIKELVHEHKLDGITVKCQYELSIEYGFTPCVALSVLGGEMPVSCEGDVYMLLTQMILNYVSGQITTYGDILGFSKDEIISAACGFAPKCFLNVQKPKVEQHTALYSGLLLTSRMKSEEKVTVARVGNNKDGFKMHLIKGVTKELNNFHEINCPQYAGTIIKLENKPVKDFMQEIMSQHYVFAFGEYYDAMTDFCKLTGIKIV